MIQVEHLTRTYGPLKAVDDVSFTIGPGEIVGLLGHNGAGKTTIMKMLTGFLEPTAGAIRIDGLDLATDLRGVQARIGYLPENCPVYPEMTVAGALRYHAGLHGVGGAELGPLLRLALARTGLTDKADQTIGTLSRGYRQRVGVARAILHRPKILILDEPTNGLDPVVAREVRALLAEEAARGVTVVLSTHLLDVAQRVCHRLGVIVRGRLQAVGDAAEVCAQAGGAETLEGAFMALTAR